MAKVLVVDDEPDYRSKLKSLLTAEGYQVETAEDGVRAIELARAFRPDVLVADWMLRSSRHGIQVCESLRHTLPSLVTILITGYPTEQLRADAARAAVFAFLEKPFEADELRDAVRRAADYGARPAGAVDPAARRIGHCSECGTPLPLLRPADGEMGQSWACAFCGNTYRAVLEPDGPNELRLNVRAID